MKYIATLFVALPLMAIAQCDAVTKISKDDIISCDHNLEKVAHTHTENFPFGHTKYIVYLHMVGAKVLGIDDISLWYLSVTIFGTTTDRQLLRAQRVTITMLHNLKLFLGNGRVVRNENIGSGLGVTTVVFRLSRSHIEQFKKYKFLNMDIVDDSLGIEIHTMPKISSNILVDQIECIESLLH